MSRLSSMWEACLHYDETDFLVMFIDFVHFNLTRNFEIVINNSHCHDQQQHRLLTNNMNSNSTHFLIIRWELDDFAFQYSHDHDQIAKIERFVETNLIWFLMKSTFFISYHDMTWHDISWYAIWLSYAYIIHLL